MANVLTEASVRNWLRRCGSVKASPAGTAGSRRDDACVRLKHEVRILIQTGSDKVARRCGRGAGGRGGGGCKERAGRSDRPKRSPGAILARAARDFPQALRKSTGASSGNPCAGESPCPWKRASAISKPRKTSAYSHAECQFRERYRWALLFAFVRFTQGVGSVQRQGVMPCLVP